MNKSFSLLRLSTFAGEEAPSFGVPEPPPEALVAAALL